MLQLDSLSSAPGQKLPCQMPQVEGSPVKRSWPNAPSSVLGRAFYCRVLVAGCSGALAGLSIDEILRVLLAPLLSAPGRVIL